jgi:hypothetical protein
MHRSTIRAVGLSLTAALALALAAPLAAQAGPLLSGYGGPGQGNQAILGSTLIGGPGGGSGGSGGSSGSGRPSEAAASGSSSAGSTVSTSAGASAGASSSQRRAHGGSHAGAGATAPAQPIRGELGRRSYHGLERAGSSALDLSAAEVVYIVLAAAALAVVGVLTRRLAGTTTAKGHS